MSFNSKQFLADRERLLEPDFIIIKGSKVWHQPVITQHANMPQYVKKSEEEILKMEDEYLESKGII